MLISTLPPPKSYRAILTMSLPVKHLEWQQGWQHRQWSGQWPGQWPSIWPMWWPGRCAPTDWLMCSKTQPAPPLPISHHSPRSLTHCDERQWGPLLQSTSAAVRDKEAIAQRQITQFTTRSGVKGARDKRATYLLVLSPFTMGLDPFEQMNVTITPSKHFRHHWGWWVAKRQSFHCHCYEFVKMAEQGAKAKPCYNLVMNSWYWESLSEFWPWFNWYLNQGRLSFVWAQRVQNKSDKWTTQNLQRSSFKGNHHSSCQSVLTIFWGMTM